MNQRGCGFGQHMVNQGPRFENLKKRRQSSGNQVISKKSGLIRPDLRKKVRYL